MARPRKKVFLNDVFIQNDQWRFHISVPYMNVELNTNHRYDVEEYSYSLWRANEEKREFRYAYNIKKGLIFIDDNGYINENYQVIGDFMKLSLKEDRNSAEELLSFIRTYGFLFELPDISEANVSYSELRSVLIRYQELFRLFGSVISKEPDYSCILELLLGFLTDNVEHRIPVGEMVLHSTFVHIFARYFKAEEPIPILPEHNATLDCASDSASPDGMYFYNIRDTYLNTTIKNTYYPKAPQMVYAANNEAPEYGWDSSSIYGRLLVLYKTVNDRDIGLRNTVDLLYHILRDKNGNNDGLFKDEFFKEKLNDYIAGKRICDDEAALALLKRIARYTIAAELDHDLADTHIVYNINSMQPSLYVKDLFTGMYLALASFDTKTSRYVRCSRQKCGRWFLDTKNDGKERYCCKKCEQAENTRRSRERKKAAIPADFPDQEETTDL